MTAMVDRNEFDRQQAEFFDAWAPRFANQTYDAAVDQRLAQICELAGVTASDRVVDVGTGCGALIPYLLRRGVAAAAILGVDLSEQMLEVARSRYPLSRFVCGNFVHLDPADVMFGQEGGASLVLFNACFGNLPDPRQALWTATRLTGRPGRIVISHPLGRRHVEFLRGREPHIVPHELPSLESLRALVGDLPLEIDSFVDEPDFYCARLQVAG